MPVGSRDLGTLVPRYSIGGGRCRIGGVGATCSGPGADAGSAGLTLHRSGCRLALSRRILAERAGSGGQGGGAATEQGGLGIVAGKSSGLEEGGGCGIPSSHPLEELGPHRGERTEAGEF